MRHFYAIAPRTLEAIDIFSILGIVRHTWKSSAVDFRDMDSVHLLLPGGNAAISANNENNCINCASRYTFGRSS